VFDNYGASIFCLPLTILALTGWSLNVYFSYILGSGDISKLTEILNGKYQVGVRKYTSSTRGNSCLVYYPMDRKDFIEQVEKKNMMWMAENQDEIIQTMISTYLKMLPDWAIKMVPTALFGVMRVCQVDCALEGKLHGDFASGKKALRPLVFSHGLSGSKDMY